MARSTTSSTCRNRVASSVVGAIEPRLRLSEIERAARKPTENLGAYDLYLRALAQMYRYTEESLGEAVASGRRWRFRSAQTLQRRWRCTSAWGFVV
jgi:hypothetical protein